MKKSRLVSVAIIAAVTASLLNVIVTEQPAEAASGAQFNPGMIISDALFFDGNAMDASAVQDFLDSQIKSCKSGYTCLNRFTQTTNSLPAVTGRCAIYSGAANESAATIIAKVGAACNISQKVLLVLLQKEQSLVTATAPSEGSFRSATGYGCPDTAQCDAKYYGFFNQVYRAALQFQTYRIDPTFGGHVAGKVNNIRFNPNINCGRSSVFIQNQATAGLYNYTPYQPNQAALANLYGTGDSCSSYGNRNFWRIYSDWFGATSASVLVRTESSPSVYLISGSVKYRVPSMEMLAALSPMGNLGFVPQSYLDAFTDGPVAGRIVRSETGKIYFIDAAIKLPFASCGQVEDYGGNCSTTGYMQLTDSQLATFHTGPTLLPVLGTTAGNRYYISRGVKHEILDDASQETAGIPLGFNVLTEAALSHLPLGDPVIRDFVFIQSKDSDSYSFIGEGKRYSIVSSDVVALGAPSRAAGALTDPSIALILDASAPFNGMVEVGEPGERYFLLDDGRHLVGDLPTFASINSIVVSQSFLDLYDERGSFGIGTFLKGSSTKTVYLITPDQARPISSWKALLSLSPHDPISIGVVSDDVAGALPKGPPVLAVGGLYRSPENVTVYVIDGLRTRIPISSFQIPQAAGFTQFNFVSQDQLDSYVVGGQTFSYGLSCAGVNYIAADGLIRAVPPEMQALFPLNFVELDSYTCDLLNAGPPTIAFIRTSNGKIYQLVGGQKRPFASMLRFTEVNNELGWMSVDDAFAQLIPTGPAA